MYICLCCVLSNVYSVSVEESVIKSSQQLRKRSSFPEGEAGMCRKESFACFFQRSNQYCVLAPLEMACLGVISWFLCKEL